MLNPGVNATASGRSAAASCSATRVKFSTIEFIKRGQWRGTLSALPADDQVGSIGQLNEDTLARLRQAEEEAARLRAELATLQAQQAGGTPDVVDTKPRRIDSVDKREDLLEALARGGPAGSRTAWLNEADVDFVTGASPRGSIAAAAAADAGSMDTEVQATVQRRLLIGGVATAGLLAFALVPTKDLRVIKPPKPLYFYLYSLLQVQEQLAAVQPVVEDAQWDQLRLIMKRVLGPPGNAQETLLDAVALLPDGSKAAQAEQLATEVIESLNVIDYNKFFDALPTKQVTGSQNAEFVAFSSAALRAAQQRLKEFLALMPRDDLAAARQQLAVASAADDE